MSEDYVDMAEQIEEIMTRLYEVHGPVSMAITIHTAAAMASLHGYSDSIKDTLQRSLHMVALIQEDKGTLQ